MAAKKKTAASEPKKARQGTSRTYADREKAGRPNRTFCLPTETDELINTLAAAKDLSRSQVIVEAVKRYGASVRK